MSSSLISPYILNVPKSSADTALGYPALDASTKLKIAQLPSLACKVNAGLYTGNNTENRTIAHGLSVTPKLVMIFQISGTYNIGFIRNGTQIVDLAGTTITVTNWGTGSFYCSSADKSFNQQDVNYSWLAFV